MHTAKLFTGGYLSLLMTMGIHYVRYDYVQLFQKIRFIALLSFSAFFLNKQQLSAQGFVTDSAQIITIRDVFLEGNKRTRSQIILRELTIKSGDTISQERLGDQLEISKNQVMNTGLFNEVILNIKNWDRDSLDLLVNVKERWYTIPLPTVNLYDRNFNVWWVDHDHDLLWIQAGIRFYQKNLTGRNDDLRGAALFGFQQRFDGQYILPYFDAVQKHGLSFSASFTQARNVAYTIENNKELIYEDVHSFQRTAFHASFDLFYKPGFNYRYTASLGYAFQRINDTIAILNPDYFLHGDSTQQYLSARLSFVRDFRDLKAYPLKGDYLDLSLIKLGLGLFDDVNLWQAYFSFHTYFQLSPKWYLSFQNRIKVSFPEVQPFNMGRGLGYGGDYVSGYEYYAVNGQSFFFSKLTLKNEILRINIKGPERNPFFKGANLPFAIFGRVYIDAGYVSDNVYYENNPLTNTLLLGGGVAADLVLIYDTSLKFEYSINRMGETGLFFHLSTYF